MNSRYEYLKNPDERRLLAAVRGVAGAVLAVALLTSAVSVQRAAPASSVAAEFAAPAAEEGVAAFPYDGAETDAPLGPVGAATRRWHDEFGGFDQLHPHAYMGEPGLLG